MVDFAVFYKKSCENSWYFKKKQYLCIRKSVVQGYDDGKLTDWGMV